MGPHLPPRQPDHRPRVALAMGLVAVLLLAFGFFNRYQNWGDDWAGYLLQARSILQGTADDYIAQNAFMLENSSKPYGPVAYPWGLPLLLAGQATVFGFDAAAFRVFNAIFLILTLVALWRLSRPLVGEGAAVSLALLLGFNPMLLHYCNHLLTEIPFAFATVYAFHLMERFTSRRGDAALAALLGLAAFGCFSIRTNGALVLAAITVRQFTSLPRSRLRAIIFLGAPYAAFVAAWIVFRAVLPGGGESHIQALRSVTWQSIVENLTLYPVALFDFFTGGRLSIVPAVLLGPIVVYGALVSRRRTIHISAYLLLTLAAYVVWPGQQGIRFMLPLVPFVLLFLFLGLQRMGEKTVGRYGLAGMKYVAPAVYVAAAVAMIARGATPREEWHPYDAQSAEMFQWVRDHTAPSDVVAFFKPRAMHLLAGRLSVTARVPDIRHASVLVYTKKRKWNEDQPSVAEYQHAADLDVLFENNNFRIYGVRPRRTASGTFRPRFRMLIVT